jgi:hypothetical protein
MGRVNSLPKGEKMAKINGSFVLHAEFMALMTKPTEYDWKCVPITLTNTEFSVDNIDINMDAEGMYNVTRADHYGTEMSNKYICEVSVKFTAETHARTTKPEATSFTKKSFPNLLELIDEVLFPQKWTIQQVSNLTIEGKQIEENN